MAATPVDEEWLAGLERKLVGVSSADGRIGLKEFKKVLTLSDGFIAERFFHIFDKTGSGSLSTHELIDGVSLLTRGSKLDKLRFIFQVYDVDGNGYIDPEELRIVIESCMGESTLRLSDKQLDDLTEALFTDIDVDGSGTITFEELKGQLERNPGLLENLTVSVPDWLSPELTKQRRRTRTSGFSLWRYIRNNIPVVVTAIVFVLINDVLFAYNAVTYWDSGRATSIARGCGLCLNFNGVAVIVLMLRKTITWIRGTAIGPFMPLDQHIDLHKVIAWLIVIFGTGHTTAHFVNFGLIANEPNATYAYWEYSFSTHTDVGWVSGSAGITGIILLLVLIVMVICSQPCVRRNGHFEVFYWTHMLFAVFYVVLLVHAKDFWKWFLVPGTAYIVERLLRSKLVHLARYGRTYIIHGTTMSSKVTHLEISRPPGFTFQPGDYVFLQIPAIAKYEWHPFTISSCPEQSDVIWLHVRSAGTWTTRLYEYFEKSTGVTRKFTIFVKAAARRVSSGTASLSEKLTQQYKKRLSAASYVNESVVNIGRDKAQRYIATRNPVECYIDGPYGTPSAHIFQADHAVLIGAGIGVTPFAAILQSIVSRYQKAKVQCPNCNHMFCGRIPQSVMKLKKVDFYWINRDQRAFEWFISLLTQLEVEQSSDSSNFDQFLEMHMYMTSALKKEDVKGICLQMAIELLHKNTQKDVITGLKTRTEAGRPNWHEVFGKIKAERKGKVAVFFCGPPALGKVLKSKCDHYGFTFRRENF